VKRQQVGLHHGAWQLLRKTTWKTISGGFNPSEKCESQLGLLFPIYGQKKMFQTTNQIFCSILKLLKHAEIAEYI